MLNIYLTPICALVLLYNYRNAVEPIESIYCIALSSFFFYKVILSFVLLIYFALFVLFNFYFLAIYISVCFIGAISIYLTNLVLYFSN